MRLKLPYERPNTSVVLINITDIITASSGTNTPPPPTPETDWEDDNVIDDGWI
ncbi:MAG: hypothetical protein IKC75_01165 [Clostridia bacterium]|nr:hypothetical protein [Clostridia bacterium]